MLNKSVSLSVVVCALAAVLVASPGVAQQIAAQAVPQDFKSDAPGQAHRIDVAALPAPGQSAADFPRIVPKPNDASRIGWPFFRDRRIDAYADLTKRFGDGG